MFCLGEKKVAGMLNSDRLRGWLSSNLAPIVFLIAYFFTVVLGSFMYLLPSARPYLDMARFTSRIFEFDTLFSTGYWLLLIAPFVVTPLIVWGVRRIAGRPLARLVDFFPEFTRTSYLTLLLLCYAIVLYSFWKADAFNLFLAGGDFSSSVEARFIIRERVSFFSMTVLMSNLHFLAIYAAVKWVREGGWWWGGHNRFQCGGDLRSSYLSEYEVAYHHFLRWHGYGAFCLHAPISLRENCDRDGCAASCLFHDLRVRVSAFVHTYCGCVAGAYQYPDSGNCSS